MVGECGCGSQVRNSFHSFACFDCGSACCPECAISLESATYCRDCAASLLETATVRAGSTFELQ